MVRERATTLRLDHQPQRRTTPMKLSSKIMCALMVAFAANSASAQTAPQPVTFQVDAITLGGVPGPPSLLINTATAGSAPTSATSSGNTWAVTTNQTGAKI